MFDFPTDEVLAGVKLTRREFLARYVHSQRQRVCEPVERFHQRILAQFYLDFPELNPEKPLTRAEYFGGVAKVDAA